MILRKYSMEKLWVIIGSLLIIGSLIFLVLGISQSENFFIGIGLLTLLASYSTYSGFVKSL